MGSFTNHVDKILSIFDHLPTPCGQAWTFHWPPTYVHVDICEPNPLLQYLDFNLLLTSLEILSLYFGDGFRMCEYLVITAIISHLLKISFSDKKWKLELISAAEFCQFCVWFFQFFLYFSDILSTWTFSRPPTYLAWTIVDIWLTTHPPHLVQMVCE